MKNTAADYISRFIETVNETENAAKATVTTVAKNMSDDSVQEKLKTRWSDVVGSVRDAVHYSTDLLHQSTSTEINVQQEK